MIEMKYTNEPDLNPVVNTTMVLTTYYDSLPNVLEDIERFLRAVYGWIPANEHLEFMEDPEDT